MADKKIEIQLATTGAEQSALAIEGLESEVRDLAQETAGLDPAAQNAGDAFDDLRSKMEQLKARAEALKQEADATSESSGKLEENVRKIATAQQAQIIGQLAGQTARLGQGFRDAADKAREFDSELAASLDNAANNIEGVSSTVSTLAYAFAAGGPLGAALAATGVMLKKTADAWLEMKSAQAEAAAAMQRHAERTEYMRSQQALLRQEINNEFVASVYRREADELARQVAGIERINQLRGELQSIEQSRANRQVSIAQAEGGDVALAEANALAVKLRGGLDALNGELAAAQARVAESERLAEQARMQYERAVSQATDPAKLAELDAAAEAARTDLENATQQFQDVTAIASAKRLDFLEGVQEDFLSKEEEYSAATSREAAKAFDSVYESLKKAAATGPQAAIAQIQFEVGTITDAATAKAAEVQQGLNTEREGTATAIQNLAPKPQDTESITSAVRGVETAIAEQGNSIIRANAAVIAGIGKITLQITRQEQQINQLFARLR